MKKNVYRVQDISSSQQQNHIPSFGYQSTASSSEGGATIKAEHGAPETTLRNGSAVKSNSKLELVSKGIGENAPVSQNEIFPSSGSQTVLEHKFSLTRVWVSITIIVVINIVVVAVIAPLLSQYLFQYFLEENMKFINTTVNSTNATATCKDTTDSEDDFINTAQKQASNIYLYANIVNNIPAFIVCLFVGSLSDLLGRRSLLIGSVLGAIIKNAILCVVIKLKLGVELIYIGHAIEGLVGSYYSTTLTVAAIITDITQDESGRAVRFAIIEGLILVFGALTQLAVGYLIEETGFFIPVLMCDCILVIPLFVIIFILPETLTQRRTFSWNIWEHIKKTFGFYFSSAGGNRRRLQFITGLTAYFTIIFTLTGKVTIETLFVLTRPICWTSIDIGIFNSAKMVVMSVAAVIFLRLCEGRLSLETIGVICGISSVGGFVFMAFADSTLLVYLSGLVGILYMTSLISPRTILSQQAAPSEQGALFSSLACSEALASMVSSTVFILIYNETLETFKGATFIVIAGMSAFYTILHGFMVCLRTSKKMEYETEIEGPADSKTDVSTKGHNSSTM